MFRRRLLARALRRLVRFDRRGALQFHHCRGKTPKAMLVEVDDRVMFVDEPNGARAVLRLRDPVANRITSHVRLLNRHYNRDPAEDRVSPGLAWDAPFV